MNELVKQFNYQYNAYLTLSDKSEIFYSKLWNCTVVKKDEYWLNIWLTRSYE